MIIALDDGYRQYALDRFQGHDLLFFDRRTPDIGSIVEHIKDAEVLGMRRGFGFLGREFFDGMPRLQFVHKSGSGVDWFDIEVLNENGILLANNSGFNASSVAEHAVLLMLLCLRNTLHHLINMRNGTWDQDVPPGDVLRLEGKSVGIVGLGQIGSHVARRVLAFGANVIAYQRHQVASPAILSGIRWASMRDLLREADVVVLCVPFTPETERLLGPRELEIMKRSAVLINCSRGKVVDEEALYDALVSGRIRAAGLDVFVDEPVAPDNQLPRLRNVVATPHVGGYCSELKERQIEGALENVGLFVSGRMPERLVNPEIIRSGTARARHLC